MLAALQGSAHHVLVNDKGDNGNADLRADKEEGLREDNGDHGLEAMILENWAD